MKQIRTKMAWKAYNEATAPARKAYEEAIAPAWKVEDKENINEPT